MTDVKNYKVYEVQKQGSPTIICNALAIYKKAWSIRCDIEIFDIK